MTVLEAFEKALREGQEEKVQEIYEQVLAGGDAESQLDLAEYLEGIGYFDLAKPLYLLLAACYPAAYISLASIAAEDGQLEEAFAYLEEIKPESDLYVAALMGKAELYQLEGLPDVAREKLAQALQWSDDPLLVFGLAELDMELGDFTQAIQEYASLDNRVIYQLTGVSTYQRIGLCYASLGRFEAAVEFLEKALEIDYDDVTLFELASILYEQEEYQKAVLYFKQLDAMSPDFEGYEYAYARALEGEHRLEEALKIAQQGLAKNPFETRLQLLASQLSYELHDVQAAEDYLLAAQEDAEDLEEISLRLTNLYLEQERYEEVLAFENQDLDNVLTRWNLARAYQALERSEKALTAYESLAPDLKNNPEFLEEYAYLLREMGLFRQAQAMAESYLSLVPDDLAMQDFLESLRD